MVSCTEALKVLVTPLNYDMDYKVRGDSKGELWGRGARMRAPDVRGTFFLLKFCLSDDG